MSILKKLNQDMNTTQQVLIANNQVLNRFSLAHETGKYFGGEHRARVEPRWYRPTRQPDMGEIMDWLGPASRCNG
ncbi:MAG: hypothetical protein V6Z86_02675 [Hyphomicrobiales bacterium]